MYATNEDTGAKETGFAEVGNGRLYYERQGVGPAVLLLHGYNLDARMWDGIFETIAKTHQAIRVDLRGFGRSEEMDEPFTAYGDIRGLLDTLQIESAFLVGHSMGGAMAVEFALVHPERVRGLFLACGALFGYQSHGLLKDTQDRFEALFKSGDMAAVLDYDLATLLDGPLATPGRVQGALRAHVAMLRQDAYVQTVDRKTPEKLTPASIHRLEEIKAPVVTQYGDLDWPNFKEISDLIASRVPNANQVLLDGTAHNGCMEKPEAFTELVLAFLADNK